MAENQLQVIVKESGLTPAKAQIILEQFEHYFVMASDWEQKAKSIVVTDASQTDEMEKAKNGRIFLRDKRNAVEKVRKELKEQSLREGKAIDGIANVLKALIVPIEEYLERQERFVQLRQKAEDDRLLAEAKSRVEEERLAKEKADFEEQERIRKENDKLRKEAEIAAEKQRKLLAEMKAVEEKAASEKRKAELAKSALREVKSELKEVKAEAAIHAQESASAEIECPFCYRKFIPKKEQ